MTICARTGKFRFVIRAAAKRQAKVLRVLRRIGVRNWVYRCEHCEGFHLTRMPREQYRAMVAHQEVLS